MNSFEVIIRHSEDIDKEQVTWEIKHDAMFPPTMSTVVGAISRALLLMQLYDVALLSDEDVQVEEEKEDEEDDKEENSR